MFTLVAATKKPVLDGIVATRSFATLEEAEKVMGDWARFGVDNLCDEADILYICDASSALVRRWDRARKASVAPSAAR